MVAQFDGLIMSSIAALDGAAEAEMVRLLLRLRDGFSQGAASAGRSTDLEDARTGAMREVDAYFKRALESVPSIKAFIDDLAASPH